MKAYQIESPHQLKLIDISIPSIEKHQVLIKVSVVGVCRTDLHLLEGDLKQASYPLIPGHQVVGRVEKIGREVKNIKIGDRVGVAWLGSTCQNCEYCLSQRENLCSQSKYHGMDLPGGYAEYMAADARYIYKLPDNFSDQEAAPLLCAGIIGYRAYLKSQVKPKENIAFYGFGSSAHLLAQIAQHQNCRLFVGTREIKHQDLAKDLGAIQVHDGSQRFDEPIDSAIIFAPAGHLVPTASRALKKGGTLVLAGIHMTQTPEMDYESCLFHEKHLCSVEANTREDGYDFLKWAEKAQIKPRIHLFGFNQAQEALMALKEDKFDGSAVLQVS